VRIRVGEDVGEVSALWLRPRGATAALAFAHGAGAGMQHVFLEAACAGLAQRGVATLRYQFPYMERGRRAPSSRPVLLATVRAAALELARRAAGLSLFAGGKSMGGRMSSLAAAMGPLPVQGLVFFGFPLHPAGKPGTERADHLSDIELPMLFLQGTRDKLAELELLRPVCDKLADRATLHVVDGADHSFHVLKRSGRSDEEALAELCDEAARWMLG
jgi:predicted alpha/beta-hydrolase family hydrolase